MRRSDPVVAAGENFDEVDAVDGERTNFFHQLPAPPDHSPLMPATTPIPAWRQVRATVDRFQASRWAPGSPGEKRGGPPPPFGTMLVRKGLVYDALSPQVRANPSDFVWVDRPVTAEDVERLERLERLEAHDAA